jgi:hypothetical protein
VPRAEQAPRYATPTRSAPRRASRAEANPSCAAEFQKPPKKRATGDGSKHLVRYKSDALRNLPIRQHAQRRRGQTQPIQIGAQSRRLQGVVRSPRSSPAGKFVECVIVERLRARRCLIGYLLFASIVPTGASSVFSRSSAVYSRDLTVETGTAQNLRHLFELESLIDLQHHGFALFRIEPVRARRPRRAKDPSGNSRRGRASPASSFQAPFRAGVCGSANRPRYARCETARGRIAPGRRVCGCSDKPSKKLPDSGPERRPDCRQTKKVIEDTLLPARHEEVERLDIARRTREIRSASSTARKIKLWLLVMRRTAVFMHGADDVRRMPIDLAAADSQKLVNDWMADIDEQKRIADEQAARMADEDAERRFRGRCRQR